ncbi:MAG: division/cell wall cluster transcriptional repressor MraZ [Myxococcota bacterium]
MFRGLYEHTMDAKGRTSLPSRFRELLGTDSDGANGAHSDDSDAVSIDDRLILTTGIDRCLVAYPVAEWQAFEAKLAALPQFDPAVVQLKRIYVAGATECSIDKHGRLLIPPMLREYAAIQRDVVWAGMVTTIEVWAKEAWNDQAAASRADRGAIAQKLGELGL